MSLGALILAYVVATLGAIALIGLQDHRKRRAVEEAPEDQVFRCEQCHYVYTDDPDVDNSRCPQCGTFNEAVQF